MKSQLLALVLLGGAMFAHAADLTMTATTTPAPPWSVTEPVEVRLTFTNHASEIRRASFQIEDLYRDARLVDRITVAAESAAYVLESDLNLYCLNEPFFPMVVMEICLWTTPILPGDSLEIVLDVAAFPDAVGYRDAAFVLYTLPENTSLPSPGVLPQRVPVRFAYGFLPDVAIPSLGAIAAGLLVFVLMLGASWRINASTRLQGIRR